MKVEPKQPEREKEPESPRNPRTDFSLEVFDRVDQRDSADDDTTPPYAFFGQISGQISRAQSGKGPIYDRIFDIVVIATAACESIKRRETEDS